MTSTNVRTALPVVLPRLETAKSCPRPVRSTLYPALRYCLAARLSAAAPLAAFLRIVRLPDLADFRFMEERRATTISAFPSDGLLVIHVGPCRGRGGHEAAARASLLDARDPDGRAGGGAGTRQPPFGTLQVAQVAVHAVQGEAGTRQPPFGTLATAAPWPMYMPLGGRPAANCEPFAD